MGKFDLKEIHEQLKETATWKDSTEKSMARKALGSMLLARMGQIEYKPGVFLDKDGLRIPRGIDWLLGGWLEYDDSNFFDGTRKISLVTGETKSSMMNREHAYYETTTQGGLDLKELRLFIREIATKEVKEQ